MKKLLLIILLLPVIVFATVPANQQWNGAGYLDEYVMRIFSPTVVVDYYVSSSGNDSNSGTSSGSPWQTLTKVETFANAGSLNPGDRILFKAGEQFAGALDIAASGGGRHAKSGTDANHITWTSYGTGAKPLMLYPGSATGSGADSRTILLLVGVRRWDFINLHFTDTDHTNDKKTGAHVGFTLYLGSPGSTKTNRCTISACDFDYVAMGPVLSGDSNIVTRCNLTNFKDLIGNSGPGDYGANSFTLLDGNVNEISYNYINGAWAQSTTFGFNGGFAEIFGICSNNLFLYNIIVDCNGVSEFGSNGAVGTSTGNQYVGNRVTDCGAAFYANLTSTFAVQVSNTLYLQNTQISTLADRFTGPNCGHGLPDSAALHPVTNCDSRAFGNNGTVASPPIWIVKDNIFQFAGGMTVFQGSTGSNTTNTYNCYKLSGGGTVNKTLGTGDFTTSSTLFVSTTGSSANWDLTLINGSPAQHIGLTDGSYPLDINGRPYVNNMGYLGDIPPAGAITFPVTIGPTTYTGWRVGP